MLIIGLTGGIGSGKSTIAKKFAGFGVPVIDTDEISHQLTSAGQPALTTIRQHFGDDVFHADGTLDRQALAGLIFNEPTARATLENILHPLIWAEVDQRLANTNAAYCVLVVPLLLEGRQQHRVDRVLVVDVTEQQQISRTQQRDQHRQLDIQAILDAQVSREERLSAADDVVDNSGTLDKLDQQVAELHTKYLLLAKQKSA